MKKKTTNALKVPHTHQHVRSAPDEPITSVGRWYTMHDDDDPEETWIACVIHIGSNYAKLQHPNGNTWRIHLDKFEDECIPLENPEAYIADKITKFQNETANLMAEVGEITKRLGIAPQDALGPETQALAIGLGSRPIDDYKAALIKAKQEDLPALFRKIESANESMALWMKAPLIPMKAEATRLRAGIQVIDSRIFNVSLYAGLVENLVEISGGQPAETNEKIRLLQRRCYMDEECLAHYEAGGMDYKNVQEFDAWLVRPQNRDRILPFPRCVVAFRIRRYHKDRGYATTIAEWMSQMHEREYDKMTFLYIRNGERVYRLDTDYAFDEKLFPDLDRQTYSGKLWASMSGGSVDEIWTDARYQDFVDRKANYERRLKRLRGRARDEFRWKPENREFDHRFGSFQPYDRTSVYYDDIHQHIGHEVNHHNRLVLILQGVLDRSVALHPHPAWRLYTDAGFNDALELVFDDSRALVDGDAPDFEAYRARCNATLKTGSITIGQLAEYGRIQAKRSRGRDEYSYRAYLDPGPGHLARVEKWNPRSKTAEYKWTRGRATRKRFSREPDRYPVKMRVKAERLFNVDAYKPGDIRQFFADPRTRADYLKWAPLLIDAEEYHAGNRVVGTPTRERKVRDDVEENSVG